MRICKMDRADQVWGKGGPVNMGALAGFGSLGMTATAAQPSFATANPGAASAYGSEASFTALGTQSSSTVPTYDSPSASTSSTLAASSELSSTESYQTQGGNTTKPTPDIRHFDSGVTNGVRDDGRSLGEGCGNATNDHLVPDVAYGIDLTSACDKHDKAYGTCGADKVKADLEFRSNLYDDCRTQEGSVATCAFISFAYSTAVLAKGGEAFDEAQVVACTPVMYYPSIGSDYGTLGNGTYDPETSTDSCRASDYSISYSGESDDSNSYSSDSDNSTSHSSSSENSSSDSSASSVSTSHSSGSESCGNDSSSSDSGGGSGGSD
jgi:hypothetical protein